MPVIRYTTNTDVTHIPYIDEKFVPHRKSSIYVTSIHAVSEMFDNINVTS